jgi:serine/threonine-protein kinase RsbW
MSDITRRSIVIVVRARLENLALLGAAAQAIAVEHLRDESDAASVELAVVELSSNVMRHGHADAPDHTFEVEITTADDRVEIEVRDEGPAFAFGDRVLPPLAEGAASLPTGGFGIGLVHESVDAVEYTRANGINRIRFLKRRRT